MVLTKKKNENHQQTTVEKWKVHAKYNVSYNYAIEYIMRNTFIATDELSSQKEQVKINTARLSRFAFSVVSTNLTIIVGIKNVN